LETWPLLNLLNLYRVNGNPEYLRVATNIAKNRMLVREQAAGGKGNFGSGECGTEKFRGDVQANTMYAYAIEPMVNIAFETGDPELEKLIVRMADWTWNDLLFGGTTNAEGDYMPLQSCYIWTADDPDGSERRAALDPSDPSYYEKKMYASGEPAKNAFWADLFAYAYHISGDSKHLERADQVFRDSMYYYTYSGNRYVNPDGRAEISFIDNGFPNTHSKVHSWLARTNQIYLHTRWQLQLGELRIVTSSLPDGSYQTPYSYPVSASGGVPEYAFALSGSLPQGLGLSSDGIISGVPEVTGSFSFTVQVTDSQGTTAQKDLDLSIAQMLMAPQMLRIID
jgi:hypothetical protein